MATHAIRFQSLINCPACGFGREETMPTDACQFYWECPACRALIRPNAGDCCVYCSYGTMPCPPVQQSGSGGRCNDHVNGESS